MTAAAAAITAEFGRNLQSGSESVLSPISTTRRGRPAGAESKHLPASSNGRHRSTPRHVGRSGHGEVSRDRGSGGKE